MVSYLMQKDMDNDGTRSGDGGRIGDASNLARSAVWESGGSEAEKWESGGIDGEKNKDYFEAEEIEEAAEEKYIQEEESDEEGSGEPNLPPKAAEFFAVSNDFYQHGGDRRYLYGAVVMVQWNKSMDRGTRNQHPAERTRNQEWRQRSLSEAEEKAEADAEAKREVGASCEEVKLREDK